MADPLYTYDGDPLGATFTIDVLNTPYVRLTVTDEDDRTAAVLVRPQAIVDAARAVQDEYDLAP